MWALACSPARSRNRSRWTTRARARPVRGPRRSIPRPGADEVAIGHGGNLEVDVDPVEQRAGDPGAVALDVQRRAAAGVGRVAEVAAGTGIHGRREHETCREREAHGRPAQRDDAVLQGLAQHLQHVAAEFGQLVEEQHPAVGQADLPGRGIDPPPMSPASLMVW